MYQALSQLDLAERSGVSRPTITRAEAGERISFANIHKIAAALGISVHELLREDPDKVKTE
jgi:transcriptional regulator with XRE-family HTH domain